MVLASAVTSRDLWSAAWSADRAQLMTDVYQQHAAAVHNRASAVCGADAAADVTQEVFLRLWRNPGEFDPTRGSLRTYLVVLARGLAIDVVRSDARRRRRDELAHTPASTLPSDDGMIVELILRMEVAARINTALNVLDVRQREAIETSFLEEMRFCDVARQWGIAEGTVKSRVRLALARLRPAVADLE